MIDSISDAVVGYGLMAILGPLAAWLIIADTILGLFNWLLSLI